MKQIKVFKAGGTSTGTAQGYELLEREIRKEINGGYKIILVVSAPDQNKDPKDEFRVTPLLRRKAAGEDTLEKVIQIYEDIAVPLGFHCKRDFFDEAIATAKRADDIVYLGEHVQAWQFNRYLTTKGLLSRWIDAREVLLTDSNFGNGKVIRINTEILSGEEQVYVVGGFYGKDERENTVILSKGGSDLTADVLAAAVGAVSNTNLKEVEGIFATDPNFVPQARIIKSLTYRELRELSYAGNTVLQEEAMSASKKAGVPIIVRSLLTPHNPGTKIVRERDTTDHPIVGIAAKSNFTIYTLKREKDPLYFKELFRVFADKRISIDMVGTENGLVTIAVAQEEMKNLSPIEDLEEIISRKFNVRQVHSNQALISVVGEGIQDPYTLRERICSILGRDISASYGPILGGTNTDTTTFYIEKFGMNSEKGFIMKVADYFAETQVPITGVSTTIDSLSIGTNTITTKKDIQDVCTYLNGQIAVDTITVTRNGLLLYGPRKVPSNITVAIDQGEKKECLVEKAVKQLYLEFF